MITDYFKVGEIASTHGLKGDVKVFPTTDDINRFKGLKECVIRTKKRELAVEVTNCKFVGKFAVLKFKGFDDINDVEQFKHCGIYVAREDAVDLDEDEFYVADLIGVDVFDEDDNKIGILTEVIPTGANDVYTIQKSDDENDTVLVPAIKDCIKSIDIENNRMVIHMMKGLDS